MSDASPPTKTKSILASKTLWVQIVMLLAALYPPVLAWITANPVEMLSVIAAVNVLVRFATSGKVTIFPATESDGAASGGMQPVIVGGLLGMTAGLMGLGLSSCTPAQLDAARAVPIKFTLITPNGDVGYSSKGGLTVDYRSGK